ncbi:MAG: substrate binding domain-containing protein [Pseudomonadales bacterium]
MRDHNYLVYSDGGSRSEIRFQEEGEPFFVRADGNFKTNNSEAMRTALLSGLGISRVSQWLVGDAIASGELVPVLSNFQPQPIDIHAVYPPGRHLPSKVRILIDYFSEEFKSCASIGGC